MSKPRKIYLASSWRNDHQPPMVTRLRTWGHEVYDFRNPTETVGDNGFHWSEIDPDWETWTSTQFIESLKHPIAEEGFTKDLKGLSWADACVMLLPCGRSASLETGYCIGSGKPTAIFIPTKTEPELMFKMAGFVTDDAAELYHWLEALS